MTPRHKHPPLATIKALIAYHNAQALAYAGRDRVACAGDGVATPIDMLLAGLPQGPITKARLVTDEPYAGLIAVTFGERNERFIELEAFLMLRILVLFAGGHIDKNNTDEAERKDYIEVFSRSGITIMRLLADAQESETVRLMGGDHHDLSVRHLCIVRGSKRNQRGRREALAVALAAYDKHAKDWGLSDHLSRWDYQCLIRDCFRLYDIKHAHRYLRVIGEPDAA
ncbi:hypothetical protein [Rhizobium mesoamericanum]|uniref:hypothetical protein n=1 Tax=Rhizobium mesoamericanum TaxID=1079800 RepID=UPI00048C6516|nr:hypothetical protein [Rhizobium mesoamericanum]